MSIHSQKRITIVEVTIVLAIVGFLAAIAAPVLLDNTSDPTQVQDTETLIDAVRKYRMETGVYPTFGATPAPAQIATYSWEAGEIPSEHSTSRFAGINPEAEAIDGKGMRISFGQKYLTAGLRHIGDTANDGTQRWRIDHRGNVRIELDNRSY